ncbi:MAG: single-stranded DNA-binding protein [Halobacteriovoraceae bacterium]|nr:single-stranded DNA-binding protein [Halobacteriovoraceae bacterium]
MINKVQLIGRAGADPSLKYTASSKAVCGLSLATTEAWKDKDGNKKESTEWHRLVVWGKGAETVNKYVKKGSLLYIEGTLKTRSWEDSNGQKKFSTEIHVKDFKFLSSNTQNDNSTQDNSESIVTEEDHGFTVDDLPF